MSTINSPRIHDAYVGYIPYAEAALLNSSGRQSRVYGDYLDNVKEVEEKLGVGKTRKAVANAIYNGAKSTAGKTTLGGLAGLVGGAAVAGPLGAVVGGLAGGYMGNVGFAKGAENIARGGWTVAQAAAKGAYRVLSDLVKAGYKAAEDRANRKSGKGRGQGTRKAKIPAQSANAKPGNEGLNESYMNANRNDVQRQMLENVLLYGDESETFVSGFQGMPDEVYGMGGDVRIQDDKEFNPQFSSVDNSFNDSSQNVDEITKLVREDLGKN